MSDEELRPLDAELATLLAHERSHVVAPHDAKARVLERVETTLFGGMGGGGGGQSAEPSPRAMPKANLAQLARPLSLMLALVLGGAGGAAIMHALEPARVVYVERPTTTAVNVAPVVTASSPASSSVPTLAEALALPAAVTGTARAVSNAPLAAPSDNGQLAQERALLDVARTALGRGDGQATLTALAKHAQRFPNGQLAEEREALGIQALLLLKRNDEARALGARFRQRYPGSVLLPAIEAALAAP
ncbi:MAG: hypothetical protein JWM74_696 [Myxococcaceae bacterium]|nr:hypothetical protein [Myxococcaceae bacterium]